MYMKRGGGMNRIYSSSSLLGRKVKSYKENFNGKKQSGKRLYGVAGVARAPLSNKLYTYK